MMGGQLVRTAFLLLAALVGSARAGTPASLDSQFLKALKPRLIGPANMSGRVTELAVYEKEPRIFYVASASGGVWKTVNNGTTMTPVFDRENTSAVGAVAVFQGDPNIVWVGTGESNARNSVSSGDGVFRSTDGGKNWQHLGLRDTHHIGRIVTHPTNPDIAYVAAMGRFWGPNEQRGIFKTIDGGKIWINVKYIDNDTGFIDLVMDPSDPNTLYGAAYQVRRDAFSGGNPIVQYGPGGGLYKTTDGGANWEKMTKGLPLGMLGRCGLTVHRKDPNILYAVVQTELTPTPVAGQGPNLTVRIKTDENGKEIKRKISPEDGGIFKSIDKGKTWTYVNSLCPRPFYYGQIRVDSNDPDRVYVLGILFHVSSNGGKTFTKDNAAKGTHVDYHALWIDPRDSHHLILGCDGGVYFSYDRSATWEHLYNLPISQFYAVGVDTQKPYKVYGGLQDNGSWGGPSATRDTAGIFTQDWLNILGFDGYYCQVDPKDANTVYCEGQYGILYRVNPKSGEAKYIRPRMGPSKKKPDADTNIVPRPEKDITFRFNWSCPILLSEHNNHTLYYGGNFVFRSTDRGDTWKILSPDLTRGKPGPADNSGHTITTLAESPLQAGLIYAGTDDGRIHLQLAEGKEWTDLSKNVPDVPEARHISRIECSRFDKGTAYLAVDRHRNDDRAPYVFKTTDFGDTWKSIRANLPAFGSVYVVREDPRNRNLLYVGTEQGLFISVDGGTNWHRHPGLPTVPVHDLVVHPRDRELVIGTHGRGIYVMDVRPLQDANKETWQSEATLFTPAPATAFRPFTFRRPAPRTFVGENPPYGASLYVYFKDPPAEAPVVTITNSKGQKMAELKGTTSPGLQRIGWRLMLPETPGAAYRPVPPGEYTATLTVGDRSLKKTLRVDVAD